MPYDSLTAPFPDRDSMDEQFHVESNHTPQITPNHSATVARLMGIRTAPTCENCGKPMPHDRSNENRKFGTGRKFKHCSEACRIDYSHAKRTSRIISKSSTITKEINRMSPKERDDFLHELTGDFIRFRIGCFRHDRNLSVAMRLQCEAITNAFLFKRKEKSIYHYWIAFVNKHYPVISKSLFDNDVLLSYAIEIGLVAPDYSPLFPPMIRPTIEATDTKIQIIEPVSIPVTTNVIPMVSTKVEQPVPAVVAQPMARVEPTKHREPIPQPNVELPSRPEFTNNDYKIWTKAIKGIKPSTIAVAFFLGIDRDDFPTETDIMRHVATLVQAGNQDAISAMQLYKAA